ncbi:glycosyltransferase [Streptomonospora sediminis]
MNRQPPSARTAESSQAAASGPHILFVLYPAFGHTLPMLPIIAELTRRGCRTTATTGAAFADRVRAAGAEAVAYTSFLSTSAPPDRLTPDDLAERTLRYLEEILAVSPTVEGACAAPPDAVVYDTTIWAPSRVLAAKWRIPAIQLIPTFASNEHFSVADRLAEVADPIDPDHPALAEFGVRLGEFAAGHGFCGDAAAGALSDGGELKIVAVPREFQVFGDSFGDDHIFVGPCLEEPPEEWEPPGDGRPVALVSLGTTVNERPELFRRCAAALAGAGWHVVMTVGARLDPADLGALPAGVDVRQWVPHGAVLRHASVFVCQGGMGSVQEALHHGVPLVVIPHHREQCANAERIEELGLGRVVPLAGVSAAAIRDAAGGVSADAGTRDRVARMRGRIRAAGGAVRAAAEIRARAALQCGS